MTSLPLPLTGQNGEKVSAGPGARGCLSAERLCFLLGRVHQLKLFASSAFQGGERIFLAGMAQT